MLPHPRGAALPRSASALVAALVLAACASPVLAERLSIRAFSAADGLGSSFVSYIMQDAAGYVWFATRDGLSRWNGYEFATVTQAGGLTGPAVQHVLQARSGEYFVICNDGSLYSYLPAPGAPGASLRPLTPGAASERARHGKVFFQRRIIRFSGRDVLFSHLYEDSRGTIWGGGPGVLVYGLGSTDTPIDLRRFTSAPGPEINVTAMLDDRSGSIWIGTNAGLLRRLPDGGIVHYSLSRGGSPDVVHALALDTAGRIWIGHGSLGVVVLDARSLPRPHESQSLIAAPLPRGGIRLPTRGEAAFMMTTAQGLPDDSITALLAASDGQVWVGTSKGLARFDGIAFTRYTKENGLCDNVVHSLWEDADHHLWVATPTGAMRIVLEGFSRYTVAEGLAADRVASIIETPDGTVNAIGVDWSISAFDGRSFHASRLSMPSGSSAMWATQAAYRDRQGRWWALANQGLFRFEPRAPGTRSSAAADRVYTVRDGLPSEHVFRAYQDRSGFLWIGTRSGDPADNGVARFDAGLARATPFGTMHGLPERYAPSAFAEDREGALWIGFYDGGLVRYRDGRFRLYSAQDGIPPGMVTALLVDRLGRLWLSTNSAGIGRVDDPSADPPRVRMYSTRDGLSSNNVRALAEDRLGRIYAGSARGVDRLDPATGRVRQYGTEDGLLSDFVTAALCDSRGDLWFGTYGGIFRLRPGQERAEEAPPIAVTGVRIAGEPRPIHELGESTIEGIVLDADERDVAIDFVSVSRHRAQGISYQYSLDPADASWSPATPARSVNFARLSPGRYRFAVRAVTPGGKVSSRPAIVAFTIRPPLWQRWWVISLASLAVAVLGAALHRYRVRRLLEIERLRMAIASDLHDDVATNLGSIAMFSTLVGKELAAPSPFLERITVLATESVEAIREIIWSIDPKPETIASLLVRLRDAMVTTCRAHGMHLSISVPDGMQQNLTPEQRKNLWLMLKEAVVNAAKHSGGTEVAVTAAQMGRQMRITVRDDGTAPSLSDQSSGRGLGTMRARAEALNGTVTMIAEPGRGTTVEFVVRLST